MADITTQSLLDPNAAELQTLNRQQAFAQALMSQGMNQPQGQIVSGRYVAPSFAQYLNPLAQTLTGAYLGNKAEEKQLQLANALRGKQAEAVQQYMDMLNPKQTELTGPTPTGAPLQTVNQANPQAAYMQAATNPYAPQALQQVALKKLTEGPKWEKATEYNKSKGVYETYVYDANSSTPESTKRIVGIEKPEMSKAEQINTGLALARARDEGIPGYGGGVSLQGNQPQNPVINNGSPMIQRSGASVATNAPAYAQNSLTMNTPQNLVPPTVNMSGIAPKEQRAILQKNAEDLQANVKNAYEVNKVASKIESLLPEAHGSGIGNLIGGAQNFFGYSGEKNAADAQLKVLSSKLLMSVPRFQGPQSDKDVATYKEAAGSIGDPTLPMNVRMAALQTIKDLNAPYAPNLNWTQPQSNAPTNTTQPTFKYNLQTGQWER